MGWLRFRWRSCSAWSRRNWRSASAYWKNVSARGKRPCGITRNVCLPALIFILIVGWATGPALAATVSGTVTDVSGNPIKDARVDHTGKQVIVSLLVGPSADEVRTDSDGRFTVTTAVPAFVVRKPGYMSRRILVTGDAQIQVRLQRSTGETQCKQSPPPKIKTRQAGDADYSATWFYIETKLGPKGVLSGSGPSYSWGAPSSSNV